MFEDSIRLRIRLYALVRNLKMQKCKDENARNLYLKKLKKGY